MDDEDVEGVPGEIPGQARDDVVRDDGAGDVENVAGGEAGDAEGIDGEDAEAVLAIEQRDVDAALVGRLAVDETVA